MAELFQRADGEVGPLYAPILLRRGVTEESIEDMAAEMVAEFIAEAS